MNTIAALTRSDPKRAEEAVEDLADLFRATLRDSHSPFRLKEELELTRIYQRIEALRLGDRLDVRWDVGALPMRAFVPGLTVQPLLENAIYHGIEPLEHGGTVTISGRVVDGEVELVVSNPVARERGRRARAGQSPRARQHPAASRSCVRRPRLADGRAAAAIATKSPCVSHTPNERGYR